MIIFNFVKNHKTINNLSSELKQILINHIDNPNSKRLIDDLTLIFNMNKNEVYDLIVSLCTNVITENKLTNETNLKTYFYNVYLHNLDLWGILYTYFNIIIYMLHRYPRNEQILNYYNKICELIKEFIIKSFNEPINRKKFISVLKSFNN